MALNIGTRVAVLQRPGNPKRERKIDPEDRDRFGDVTYVSNRGWATVRLNEGYTESFWMNKLVEVQFEEGETG